MVGEETLDSEPISVAGVDMDMSTNDIYTIEVSEDATASANYVIVYYYDAVKWAVDAGVTKGKSDTIFAPMDINTRAHIITFLWRMMGEP